MRTSWAIFAKYKVIRAAIILPKTWRIMMHKLGPHRGSGLASKALQTRIDTCKEGGGLTNTEKRIGNITKRSYNAKTTILIIDHGLPTPERDAGSKSMCSLIRLLWHGGCNVVLWPLYKDQSPAYMDHEGALNTSSLPNDNSLAALRKWIENNSRSVSWVIFSRPHVAEVALAVLGRNKGILYAYYGHDLHYKRIFGETANWPSFFRRIIASRMAGVERRIWKRVNLVYYPATDEVIEVRKWLAQDSTVVNVRRLPVACYAAPIKIDRDKEDKKSKREGGGRIIVVAGFRHRPNVAGVLWFTRDVMPLISAMVPTTSLMIVGSFPPRCISSLSNSFISVASNVSDKELHDLYTRADIAVAPVLYGAGVNLKIVEAMYHGVPCVTTSQGMRGFDCSQDVLSCADDAASFMRCCTDLITNRALRDKRSKDAGIYLERYFGYEAGRKAILPLLEKTSIRDTIDYP